MHGYGQRELERLDDQAGALVDLLHSDTSFAAGSLVLEAGCGVGAQTVTLAERGLGARFVSVDISMGSLLEARRRTRLAGFTNVEFLPADVFNLPFAAECFDHVFVCFLLEHLSRPLEALATIKTVIKPGGTVTVIEGDHGSAYFHPDSQAAREAIACLVEVQRQAGGNALVGREIHPLLVGAGFDGVHVSPRTVYVDSSHPDMVDAFTKRTFTAMIEGVCDEAVAAGLIDRARFETGVRDLYRTTESDGVFCYTFFKGTGRKPLLPG